jgi:hypothetical protein
MAAATPAPAPASIAAIGAASMQPPRAGFKLETTVRMYRKRQAAAARRPEGVGTARPQLVAGPNAYPVGPCRLVSVGHSVIPKGWQVNSRGRQPTEAGAVRRPALQGPNPRPAQRRQFDPFRVALWPGRTNRGLHPRLFTFQPFGLPAFRFGIWCLGFGVWDFSPRTMRQVRPDTCPFFCHRHWTLLSGPPAVGPVGSTPCPVLGAPASTACARNGSGTRRHTRRRGSAAPGQGGARRGTWALICP